MKYSVFLEEMFKEVVLNKRADLQADYYHKDFKLIANGIEQGYDDYVKAHEKLYQTPIQYKINIDRETITDGDEKAAMRVFITLENPGEEPKEIEVILVASFKDEKIYRVWELTRPDWTQMEYFKKDYLKKGH